MGGRLNLAEVFLFRLRFAFSGFPGLPCSNFSETVVGVGCGRGVFVRVDRFGGVGGGSARGGGELDVGEVT